MKHTRFIQLNKYYYKCEVTNLFYIGISMDSTYIKFKCTSELNKGNIVKKRKIDVVMEK